MVETRVRVIDGSALSNLVCWVEEDGPLVLDICDEAVFIFCGDSQDNNEHFAKVVGQMFGACKDSG